MVWVGTPGSGDLTIAGEFTVASTHNILLGSAADAASGQNMVAIANALTDPSSLAGLVGGVLYVHSGSLIYMGATGTITSLAAL